MRSHHEGARVERHESCRVFRAIWHGRYAIDTPDAGAHPFAVSVSRLPLVVGGEEVKRPVRCHGEQFYRPFWLPVPAGISVRLDDDFVPPGAKHLRDVDLRNHLVFGECPPYAGHGLSVHRQSCAARIKKTDPGAPGNFLQLKRATKEDRLNDGQDAQPLYLHRCARRTLCDQFQPAVLQRVADPNHADVLPDVVRARLRLERHQRSLRRPRMQDETPLNLALAVLLDVGANLNGFEKVAVPSTTVADGLAGDGSSPFAPKPRRLALFVQLQRERLKRAAVLEREEVRLAALH